MYSCIVVWRSVRSSESSEACRNPRQNRSVVEPSRQLNPNEHVDVSKCLCSRSVLLKLKIQIQLAEQVISGTENQTETNRLNIIYFLHKT